MMIAWPDLVAGLNRSSNVGGISPCGGACAESAFVDAGAKSRGTPNKIAAKTNIERRTSNAEHPASRRGTIIWRSLFDVRCSMFICNSSAPPSAADFEEPLQHRRKGLGRVEPQRVHGGAVERAIQFRQPLRVDGGE